METDIKVLNEVLAAQLNAFCIRLDLSCNVIDFFGNSDKLGFNRIDKSIKIFDLLPTEVSEKLLQCIQTNLKTNATEKVAVEYTDNCAVKKKVNIISNLIDSESDTYFLVTFILFKDYNKNREKSEADYESYLDAKKKLEFSEKRYTSFFENDPVMHFSVNPATGLIADCNKFAVNKLGISHKSEVLGKPVYTIFTDEKYERCLFLLKKFKTQGYLDSEEMELKTKQGDSIPVILYTTAQRDENGKIILSRSTLVDISELKNTQKRLDQKRKRLEIMNKELEQFVSTCSHDLQEPLATIKFANDLIGKLYGSKLDQNGRDYVKYVDEAVDRLTKQIRSLLSHIRLGQNAERSVVDVTSLLDTVLKDLGKSISNSNAKIVIENTLPIIKAYKVELRLLFQNIISNAIKYRKDDVTPLISISSAYDQDYHIFSISDNGIGISALNQKEIFKIFNRVNDDSPHKGDGVGLAHCEKIVRMHEGSISVESEEGEGSIFTFKLKKDYLL